MLGSSPLNQIFLVNWHSKEKVVSIFICMLPQNTNRIRGSPHLIFLSLKDDLSRMISHDVKLCLGICKGFHNNLNLSTLPLLALQASYALLKENFPFGVRFQDKLSFLFSLGNGLPQKADWMLTSSSDLAFGQCQ